MPRWYVIENGQVLYSCAERNNRKASNFAIDHAGEKASIVLAENEQAAIERDARGDVDAMFWRNQSTSPTAAPTV